MMQWQYVLCPTVAEMLVRVRLRSPRPLRKRPVLRDDLLTSTRAAEKQLRSFRVMTYM